MRHEVVARWAQGASVLHRRDARAKSVALLLCLIGIALSPLALTPLYFALLLVAVLLARLPLPAVLGRAAWVLPFTLTFALVSWLGGDAARAVVLLVKSYLSALAAITLVATTPLPKLLAGLEALGCPAILILIVQFLYRYLFVLVEQAERMRQAARCRGGQRRSARQDRFRAAAGALAVLFGRSLSRAQGIHNAMLSRGFGGHMHLLQPARFRLADACLILCSLVCAAAPLLLRYLVWR